MNEKELTTIKNVALAIAGVAGLEAQHIALSSLLPAEKTSEYQMDQVVCVRLSIIDANAMNAIKKELEENGLIADTTVILRHALRSYI